MKLKIKSKILGPMARDSSGDFNRHQRYAYMQRLFVSVMFGAIIVPLTIITSLSFYQYRNLSERDTSDKLRIDALSAKRSFEFHVNESLSTMSVVSEGYGYGQLFDQTNLERLFTRLRNEYWWLVDLGALDSSGVQRAYVGPYPFQGINYSDQEWFQKAFPRKTFVSDVFTGYRGLPHFVVTVSNGVPGSDSYWMLRASIDSEHLAQYITTINSDASTDMFLVASDGRMQTQSPKHGNLGDIYATDFAPASDNVTVRKSGEAGAHVLTAAVRLEELPWTLVMERRVGETWGQFQTQFIAIVLISALAALYVIFRVNRVMIAMVKRADDRRDQMLAEAQHTAKLASVGQLAAGVAHEINNPLAIISEKIGLIKDLTKRSGDFPDKDRFLTLADGAADAVSRCKDITHRLLGFARRMDVVKERLHINDVIRDVVSFVEKEALYRNINLHLVLDEELPRIESDRGQLQQIFLNIINNAIDAVDKDGRITIRSTAVPPATVRVLVSDTGPGIPENIIDHIFEPFFTTKIKNDTSGTGLGLSITYGLVKKLCGRIIVESPKGEGATFIVDFPVECDMEGYFHE